MWVRGRERACVCARVTIVIQHETHMSRIVCGLSHSTKFFDIILQKHDFPEKVTKQKTCVFYLFETFRTLRRIHRDIVIHMKTSSCKVAVIIMGF
jgi:hypothetical protein